MAIWGDYKGIHGPDASSCLAMYMVYWAYSSLRLDVNTLNILKEIKTRMEREYVRPLSFDFVLKKIIEKEERKLIILN